MFVFYCKVLHNEMQKRHNKVMAKKDLKKLMTCVLVLSFFLCLFAPARKVFGENQSFTVFADGNKYVYYYPQLIYSLKEDAVLLGLDGEVERIVADNYVAPQNATLVFDPQKKEPFEITKEKNGRKIDGEKLKRKIEWALFSGINEVSVKSQIVLAEITFEELKKETFLRGEFSTEYPFSSAERKSNILLASSFINGAIIEPEGAFSFNERVGIRSKERGFLSAKVIENGQFIDGVGGGVCQVSSTLYNAALLAGLKVTESHRHSLQVSYVNPSFDAMVSDYFSDLKFVNDTASPIYISAIATDKKLCFKIYGEERKYRYELVSEVKEIILANTKNQKRQSGEEVDKIAKNGLKSEGYIYIYDGDTLIEKKKIRSDTYKAIDGIIYFD